MDRRATLTPRTGRPGTLDGCLWTGAGRVAGSLAAVDFA